MIIPSWTDILESISTAVGSLVSLALLYVAIRFRADLLTARRRPLLTLSHMPSRDAVRFISPHESLYLRLAVENARGKDMALGVKLTLITTGPDSAETTRLPVPVPSRPFLSADTEVQSVDIPSGSSRGFSVAYVDAAASSRLHIRVNPRSSTERDIIPAGRYRLLLEVSATNADVTYWEAAVKLKDSVEASAELADLFNVVYVRRAGRTL